MSVCLDGMEGSRVVKMETDPQLTPGVLELQSLLDLLTIGWKGLGLYIPMALNMQIDNRETTLKNRIVTHNRQRSAEKPTVICSNQSRKPNNNFCQPL